MQSHNHHFSKWDTKEPQFNVVRQRQEHERKFPEPKVLKLPNATMAIFLNSLIHIR